MSYEEGELRYEGEWVREVGRGEGGRKGERLSVKEEGRGGGTQISELNSSDLDLDPVRQNNADPLDSDPQHWFFGSSIG